MPSNNSNEWVRFTLSVALSVLTAVCTISYAAGGFKSEMQSTLAAAELRISRVEEASDTKLASAVSARKADQALMVAAVEAKIDRTNNAVEAAVVLLREVAASQQKNNESQQKTQEAVARLEVAMQYLRTDVDGLKSPKR